MEHASAVAAITKASSGSFAMLKATACRCCVRINSCCTSGSFRSTKPLTVTWKVQKSNRCLVSHRLIFQKFVWKMNYVC